MSAGMLGAQDLPATTNTTVYHPTAVTGAIAANFCNRTAGSINVRLAVSATATPAAAEWKVYDLSIPANGFFERTGLVVGAGQYLVAYASATGMSVQADGYEDA